MVTSYVPDVGDIVMMNFDPQIGREQAKRRPALVLTDQRYNRASGLAIVCPLTSKRKPYPFVLPVTVGQGRWRCPGRPVKEHGLGGPQGEFPLQS
jgi:mRNA-degrading endonuclease toxin of MazEF toxin-antitoxin module